MDSPSTLTKLAKAVLARVPPDYGMREEEAVDYARAILDALAEPTDGMVEAGRVEFWVDPDDHGGDISEGTRQAWQAMIQHIRNGGA